MKRGDKGEWYAVGERGELGRGNDLLRLNRKPRGRTKYGERERGWGLERKGLIDRVMWWAWYLIWALIRLSMTIITEHEAISRNTSGNLKSGNSLDMHCDFDPSIYQGITPETSKLMCAKALQTQIAMCDISHRSLTDPFIQPCPMKENLYIMTPNDPQPTTHCKLGHKIQVESST